MAKKPAVFLFGPDDIEGDNVENAHVFDGHYDTVAKKWIKDGVQSRCGNLKAKAKTKSLLRKTDEDEFCHAVIDGHGLDFDACGMCMASFFADGK